MGSWWPHRVGKCVSPCDTLAMSEIRTALTLIQGDFSGYEAEIAHLLEDMPAKLAMPKLRALHRRIRPAANSSLEVVEPEKPEGLHGAAQSPVTDE